MFKRKSNQLGSTCIRLEIVPGHFLMRLLRTGSTDADDAIFKRYRKKVFFNAFDNYLSYFSIQEKFF
jgi:hypothetical protein